MADKVLNDTSEGKLLHTGNELLNDSKVLDPPAYRMGAPADQRSLGKFSGDILDGDHRQEVVLVQFKQTENAQNQLSGRGGEYYLGLAKENAGSNDDAMVDALTATVKDGFRFRLPIYAPNLQGGGIPAPSSGEPTHDIWSPDGYSVTQMNDGFVDAGGVRRPGNFVTYGLARAWDKSRYMATFSSDTGPIPNDQRKWEGAPE